MSKAVIRQSDTTVEKNENGSVTVSATVPGEAGDVLHSTTYYGFSKAAAEREYRRVVNEQMDLHGYVP